MLKAPIFSLWPSVQPPHLVTPMAPAELPSVSQQVHGLHDAFGKTSDGPQSHGRPSVGLPRLGVSEVMGVPQASHFRMVYFMEIPIKMDDLGVALFQEATWRLNKI